MMTSQESPATSAVPVASSTGARYRNGKNSVKQQHYRGQFQLYRRHGKEPDHLHQKDADDEAFAKLRTMYGVKLQTLKEVFTSEWSDKDLLTILDEVQGDVDTAIDRISQGHGEKWGEVNKSKKKDKKEVAPSLQPCTSQSQASEEKSFTESRPSRAFRERGGFRGRGRGGPSSYRDRHHESCQESVKFSDLPDTCAISNAADDSSNLLQSTNPSSVDIVNTNYKAENELSAWGEDWGDSARQQDDKAEVRIAETSNNDTYQSSSMNDNFVDESKPSSRGRSDHRSGGGWTKKKPWTPNISAGRNNNSNISAYPTTNTAEYDASKSSNTTNPHPVPDTTSMTASKPLSAAPSGKSSAAVASWAKVAAPAPPQIKPIPTSNEKTIKLPAKDAQRLADKPMTHKLPPGPKAREKAVEHEKLPVPESTTEPNQAASVVVPTNILTTPIRQLSRSCSSHAPLQQEHTRLSLATSTNTSPKQHPPQQPSQQEEAPTPIQSMSRPPPGLNKQPGQNRAVQQPRKKQDAPVNSSSVGLTFGSVRVAELGETASGEITSNCNDYNATGTSGPIQSSIPSSITLHHAPNSNVQVLPPALPLAAVLATSAPSSSTISKTDIVPPAQPVAQYGHQSQQQQQSSQRAIPMPVQVLRPGIPPMLSMAPGPSMTVPDSNAFASQVVQLGGFAPSGLQGDYAPAWGAENRGMVNYYDSNSYGQSSAPSASPSPPKYQEVHISGLGQPVSTMSIPSVAHMVQNVSGHGPAQGNAGMAQAISGPPAISQGQATSSQSQGPIPTQSQQNQQPHQYMPFYPQYPYPPGYYIGPPPQQYQTPYSTQYGHQTFTSKSMYPPYAAPSSASSAQASNKITYPQNQMYVYDDTDSTYKVGMYGAAGPGMSGFGANTQNPKTSGVPQQVQDHNKPRNSPRYPIDFSNRNYSALSSITNQSALSHHHGQQQQYPPPAINLDNAGNFISQSQPQNVAGQQQSAQGYSYNQPYYNYPGQGLSNRGNQQGYWNQ